MERVEVEAECKGWCGNDINNGGGGQTGSVHLNPPPASQSVDSGQASHFTRTDLSLTTIHSGQWTVDTTQILT